MCQENLATDWKNTTGYELTCRDLGNTIQFSFFMMQFFQPSQKITIPKCFYSSYIEKQIPKPFLLLPLKAISIHVHHVHISFVFAAPAHELSWHKILFSKVNWGHCFFLFHWVYYIKFILTRICIHKHQIFSGLDKSNVLNIFI